MAFSLRTTLLLVTLVAMLMISISPSFSQEEKSKKVEKKEGGEKKKKDDKAMKKAEKEIEEDLKDIPKPKPKSKGSKGPKKGGKKNDDKADKGESQALKRVCNSTARYDQCLKILKSDPRALKADYPLLAEVAIDLAYAQAKDIVNTLAQLAKDSNDTRLKKRFNACGKYYKTAFTSLDNAKKHLKKKDYQQAEDEALDALEESGACEGHFIVGEPEEPKILAKKNKEFEFRIALCPVAIEWLLAKD